MKHAIILAHPEPKSLNAAIAKAYAAAVRKLGHKAVVRDLYAMGFDPCLKAAEIPGASPPTFGADVKAERKRLADADVFVFVYPFWFNAPPAILKGYVDRVFGMGFGFRPAFGGTEPALTGRRLLSFSTSGAPEAWVRSTGAMDALARLFDQHLAGTCGLEVAGHVHFGGVVTGLSDEAVQDILSQVRAAAETKADRAV